MFCPTCGSSDLKKSKSANARLVFPFPLFMVWVRCHACGRKFRRFGLFPASKVPAAIDRPGAVGEMGSFYFAAPAGISRPSRVK
jgi:transposase-like protein